MWDSEPLFEKAAVYFGRAYASEREGDEFPLYVTLGFELLARAALANVHPALLADPKDGEHLLFAFGFVGPKSGQPKSIPMKSVLHRLVVVLEDFTDEDFKFATSIIEMRNGELHSADMPFDSFKPAVWLPELLRLCELLSVASGKTLIDLLGSEDAKTASEMIAALDDTLRGEALKAIAKAKKAFDLLEVADRESLAEKAHQFSCANAAWADRVVACPACGSEALVSGKPGRVVETVANEGEIEEKTEVLPAALNCVACGLKLTKHGHLFHSGLGGLYTVKVAVEPVDYFGIEFDPADYFEPEYGND